MQRKVMLTKEGLILDLADAFRVGGHSSELDHQRIRVTCTLIELIQCLNCLIVITCRLELRSENQLNHLKARQLMKSLLILPFLFDTMSCMTRVRLILSRLKRKDYQCIDVKASDIFYLFERYDAA